MEERLNDARRSHAAILAVVGGIVLMRLGIHALTTTFLVLDDPDRYRVTLAIGTSLGATLDVLLLILVWMLFVTIGRVERESERMQAFMDTVYRKIP